jgi:proline iminopeptidase
MTVDDVLFPPIEPFAVHQVAVDEGHTLHVEECGNPKGAPLFYLHGGPGSGFRPHNRRYFDPTRWRTVLFDQRGCGRSTPHAETRANTTRHLVADIEAIRRRLGIEAWTIAGGS